MASKEMRDEATAPKRRTLEPEAPETDRKEGFFLLSREKFNRKLPFYRPPKEVGYFSLDMERQISYDKSRLRYYYMCSEKEKAGSSGDVCFDLRLGFKEMIQKDDDSKEYIDNLLRWILKNRHVFALKTKEATTSTTQKEDTTETPTDDKQKETSTNSSNLNTDFVCWRGCLTRLLCSPYENREGWLLAVTRFNDTFYLCEFDTEEKKKMEANRTDFQKEMCYWGWKFEQYLTTAKRDGKPDTSSPVNNCEAYCTIIRTRLNSHSLCEFAVGGEVDCIDDKGNYIELKTSREMFNSNQNENFKRFKLIKWWCQSFLPGVPKIICGFRDDNGVVHRLQEFKTLKIPDIVKEIRNPWTPNVCFNFLDDFFSFIKDTVKVNDHRNVYLFSRVSKSYEITWRNLGRDSEFQFLPQWYIDEFKK